MKTLLTLIALAIITLAEVPETGKRGDVSYKITAIGPMGSSGHRIEMECPDTQFDAYSVTVTYEKPSVTFKKVVERNREGPASSVDIKFVRPQIIKVPNAGPVGLEIKKLK